MMCCGMKTYPVYRAIPTKETSMELNMVRSQGSSMYSAVTSRYW